MYDQVIQLVKSVYVKLRKQVSQNGDVVSGPVS